MLKLNFMKNILLTLTFLSLLSCSKSDIADTPVVPLPPIPPAIEKPITFTITPQNHEGGFANFQVNEFIGYDLRINDPNNTIDATYELKPIGLSQTKHQIIGSDFLLGTIGSTNSFINTGSLVYDSNGGDFKIKILKAGSFYLKFSLQKRVLGKNIGEPIINEDVKFSAVQFYLYVNYGRVGNRWDRDFIFNVHTGTEAGDTYFSDPNFTYTYSTSVCSYGGYSGNLASSGNLFSPSRRAGSGNAMFDAGLGSYNCNNHNGYVVDEIAITYRAISSPITGVIRYKNVYINEERHNL
ncbi:putative lipoprotein [Flavobacterium psychrophilum]|nr:putative lipoprotein [Flavobacterium psychrophilum]